MHHSINRLQKWIFRQLELTLYYIFFYTNNLLNGITKSKL
jgi:hypothetical protein